VAAALVIVSFEADQAAADEGEKASKNQKTEQAKKKDKDKSAQQKKSSEKEKGSSRKTEAEQVKEARRKYGVEPRKTTEKDRGEKKAKKEGEKTGEEKSKSPVCVTHRLEPRFMGFGFDHFVRLDNGCDKRMQCEVTTNLNPDPQTVKLEPFEKKPVLTFRGSPAMVFKADVHCEPVK
jgi:hypothetical protein